MHACMPSEGFMCAKRHRVQTQRSPHHTPKINKYKKLLIYSSVSYQNTTNTRAVMKYPSAEDQLPPDKMSHGTDNDDKDDDNDNDDDDMMMISKPFLNKSIFDYLQA
jgi:hypothetical protein